MAHRRTYRSHITVRVDDTVTSFDCLSISFFLPVLVVCQLVIFYVKAEVILRIWLLTQYLAIKRNFIKSLIVLLLCIKQLPILAWVIPEFVYTDQNLIVLVILLLQLLVAKRRDFINKITTAIVSLRQGHTLQGPTEKLVRHSFEHQ